MATSKEVRRGGTSTENIIDSDIFLGPTITALELKGRIVEIPVEPGSIAYNRAWWQDNITGKIKVTFDVDGKWYHESGTEVS